MIDSLMKFVATTIKKLPIKNGGTGATDARRAITNLVTVDPNTVPKEDTPAAWTEFGNSIIYMYNSNGENPLGDNFPTTYGTLITLFPSTIMGTTNTPRITQIWQRQGYGNLYVRAGNTKGWNGSETLSGKDAWKRVIDDDGAGAKVRQTITLTRNGNVTPEDNEYDCYLDPVNNRVYFNAHLGARKIDYAANESQKAYTVPERYRPKKAYALSFYSGSSTSADAVINEDGEIILRTNNALLSRTWHVYLTGWWDLD